MRLPKNLPEFYNTEEEICEYYGLNANEFIDLYLDIETYSSVDITSSGNYKYVESPDFEILILCYKINDGEIKTVDLASGEDFPYEFIYLMNNPRCRKHAHNATFERLCFRAIGIDIPISQWRCSAVKAAYCGLPLSLDNVSKAMQLGEASKDAEGKGLIRYFSVPVKPTKINGGRTRNLPHHNPEKWKKYKTYCKQDVYAEYTILERLKMYEIPENEQEMYSLDQHINDRGIKIDVTMASSAIKVDNRNTSELIENLKNITKLVNPNSPAQLKAWLSSNMQKDIKTLNKENIPLLLNEAGHGSVAWEVLDLRVKSSKTSIKKYAAMIACLCQDGRAHGLFQFYGANRTGRWAGRLIQLQNLPQNKIGLDKTGFDELHFVRMLVRQGKYAALYHIYDDLGSILSQLVRTAFIPDEGKIFGVADFSAIEARIIAWLASEQWRLDVFNSHGMIYEASASKMFSIPLNSISYKNEKGEKIKGENYGMRAKGKVAELALGYQGGVGAMVKFGADKMGLTKKEMKATVKIWREANPRIVELWQDIENCAILAVRKRKEIVSEYKGIKFSYDGNALIITLPSGRSLYYQQPCIVKETKYEFKRLDSETGEWNLGWAPLSRITKLDIKTGRTWDVDKLVYMGMHQEKKIWTKIDTYGGKLVENIVQAIARDILAESLIKLNKAGYDIVMHVHDEVVAELPVDDSKDDLNIMCDIMSEPIEWAEGLPLGADGYITEYYKKDTD